MSESTVHQPEFENSGQKSAQGSSVRPMAPDELSEDQSSEDQSTEKLPARDPGDQADNDVSAVSSEPMRHGDATVISNRPEPMEVPGAPSMPAELGRILEGELLGHFQLEKFIGGGGMGAVFYGTDTVLGRPVAIKVLLAHFAHDDETIQRFHNEAQSAARLDHENIARVYFVGADRGWHYMVLEFVDGENLRDRVYRRGPLPIAEVVSYTIQIAEAIAHTSERDVVHRDIKPSNVLVNAAGHAKLVDMGLARLHQVEKSHEDLTSTGVTLGTFDYIAPEQARDPRSADVRSDLYSLGCTYYFMLTGRPPFPEGTVLQKLLQHQNEPPPDPRQIRSNIPESVCNVAAKLLAKSPEDRYQDPHQLMADLLIVSDQLNLPHTSKQAPILIAPAVEPPSWSRRHLPWLVPLGLLLAIGAMIHYASPSSVEFNQDPAGTVDPPKKSDLRQPGSSANQDAGNSDPADALDGKSNNSDLTTDDVGNDALTKAASANSAGGGTSNIGEDRKRNEAAADDENLKGGDIARPATAPGTKNTRTAAGDGDRQKARSNQTLLVVTNNPTENRQYATLSDACRIAMSGDVIELRFNGRLDEPEKPIMIADRKLTIRGGEGFQPIVHFRPSGPDRLLYPRGMLHVAGGELILSNVHLELDIPAQVRSEDWSMFQTVLANRIRLIGCTLTLRNADGNQEALYQNVSFFHAKAAPRQARTMLGEVQEPLPRLQLQLRDCIARGEAGFLRGTALDTVQLQLENGLIAISEPFVTLEGQSASSPPGAHLELDFKHVTCLSRAGFCRMRSRDDQRSLPQVRVDCSDSILIVADKPLIEQVGAQTPDEFTRLISWNASNNFYEDVSEYWRIDGDGNAEVVSMSWGEWQEFWGPGRERNDRPMPVLWKAAADPDTPLNQLGVVSFLLDDSDANPARAASSDGTSDAGMRVSRLPRPTELYGPRLSHPAFRND